MAVDNNFGFDPEAVANTNSQNTRDAAATLEFQKGLGSVSDMATKQKEFLLQQGKALHDQLNKEKDDYAVIFGNKDYSPQAKKEAYNSWVAIDKALNKQSLMQPMDKWDANAEALSKDIGAARQELATGKIDRTTYNKRVTFSVGAAMKDAASMDEITSLEDVQKKAMEAVSGSVQEANAGGQTVKGPTNPLDNSIEPFKTPVGPAVSTNVPAQTFQQEYQPGGLKQQEIKIKQQNADTASSLLGQKAAELDAQTSKTLLDALNSSDKAKGNMALKQLLADSDPTGLVGYFIDENKLQNDQIRKSVTDALAKKLGVQAPPVGKTGAAGQQKSGKLMWNGKELNDTPANRAWLKTQGNQ